MGNELHDELQEIINGDNGLPAKVSNRLLLAAILDNRRAVDKAIALSENNARRIDKLEENPSITMLFRRNPGKVAALVMVIFFSLELLAQNTPEILQYILSLL